MRLVRLLAVSSLLALAVGSVQAQERERYTYLHHATPTNVFWQAVKKGMDEACAQIDADCQMVFLQQDGNFQEQLNNLEATIAQKPDGIIMTFAGGEVFDETLARAEAARDSRAGLQRRSPQEGAPPVLHRAGPGAGRLRPSEGLSKQFPPTARSTS